MHYNVNKIHSFEVKEGIIDSISVYIDDLNKYVTLEGYEAPQTAYKIARFSGEEAISRILDDIGFNQKLDLKLSEDNYNTYLLLSDFVSDDSRIIFNGKYFLYPVMRLNSIKKVVLNKDETVNSVQVNLGESCSLVTISYLEYMFAYAVWVSIFTQKDLIDDLKNQEIVEDYLGNAFNYYKGLEYGNNKIVRRIVNSNGTTITGVFLVNVTETLLKFKAIENGNNLTYKEEIPKDTVFYMSNSTISFMQ